VAEPLILHHVGILVANIPEASALYEDRFGYKIQTPVIHDPVQGAHVQFLKLATDNSFLEFVSPDGPQSVLSNALRTGGGIHHLCYSTPDVEQCCNELRGKGMSLIRPPVAAAAFPGRRIAWLMGRDRVLLELVDRSPDGGL